VSSPNLRPRGCKYRASWADDQLQRLNSLYWILDENANRIKFELNWAQEILYRDMWYRNVVLKGRQIGITTFFCLWALDTCIFNANQQVGIIAHHVDDAKEIFLNKIKYPYDNLEEGIRQSIRADTEKVDKLQFSNNSSVRVGTSMRSGTLQILLVTELGKMARKYPEKAAEVKTGAFGTVHRSGVIVVESTSEGKDGEFYALVNNARKKEQIGTVLNNLEFRFFFFAWWKHPKNILPYQEATRVVINQRMIEYFDKLEHEYGIELSRGQKAWYILTEEVQGDRMRQEHPSTPDEAFEAKLEGAIFGKQMARVRMDRRITKVPHQDGIHVDTWWDIGRNDYTAIWFTQTVGRELHAIDYFESHLEVFSYYAGVLKDLADERGYRYGLHNGPHDLGVHEYLGPGTTRYSQAEQYGIKFNVAPRSRNKQDDLSAARNFFSLMVFDEERCATGISRLDNYRYAWDATRGQWKDEPLKDGNDHCADAFQVLAKMHHLQRVETGRIIQLRPTPPTGGWT